jgi:hypothetical protein
MMSNRYGALPFYPYGSAYLRRNENENGYKKAVDAENFSRDMISFDDLADFANGDVR